MPDIDPSRFSEAELLAEFDRLFPQGFAGPDVLQELAPEGWENSPLRAVIHPSLAQVFEPLLNSFRRISPLRKSTRPPTSPPPPTRNNLARKSPDNPLKVQREVGELVGKCLWDVFSDGKEVVAPDGGGLDLGTERASARILAEILNRQLDDDYYNYLDFYIGTGSVARYADLTPVYCMIFGRLRGCELDWTYHFPRLHAIDARPPGGPTEPERESHFPSDSPSEPAAKAKEDAEYERNLAAVRASHDRAYRTALEASIHAPAPTVVRAYEMVYNRLPRGWPPAAARP
jgi:hypothetical protein